MTSKPDLPNIRLSNTVKELISKFDSKYMLAEVGVAGGNTALWTLKTLAENRAINWFHTIDPFGDKPYNINGSLHTGFNYGDNLYKKTISELYNFACENDLNYTHWKMRSQDFVDIFDNIEFWGDGEVKQPEFCYAYLDGEHAWEPILKEFDYFYNRMPEGAKIIIDDYHLIDGEETVKKKLGKYKGEYELINEDSNYRIYFTK